MKKIHNIIFLISMLYVFSLNAIGEEMDDKKYLDIVSGWKNTLLKSRDLPRENRIQILVKGVSSLGWRIENSKSPNRYTSIYKEFQEEIVKIPGHAKFVDHEHAKNSNDPKTFDDRLRLWGIQTLIHLPSPETLQVLGNYLDDFRETTTPDLPIEDQVITKPYFPGLDYVINGNLPWLATYAIATIGLREPPLANMKLTIYAYDPECTDRWKTTRAWYQEVKAGKRTFSFRGQPVEYRFNADGTWETIALKNPPDDAITYPRPSSAKPTDVPAELANTKNTVTKESPWWQWLIGALLVIIATISWRTAAKRRNLG